MNEVQEKQRSESTPRGENGYHPHMYDAESIERARHQTGSSTTSGLHYFSSPPQSVEESPGSHLGSASKHHCKFLSGDDSDRSPTGVDLAKYVSKSRGIDSDYHHQDSEDIHRLLPPDIHRQIPAVSGDSIFPGSAAGEQQAAELEASHKVEVERLRAQVERLHGQLKEEAEMNENLRGEIKLYERLKPSANVGVQNFPVVGSHASQTTSGRQGLGLEDHLAEIRLLRHRLEESVQKNDHLREQLEKQLAQAKNGGV